MDKLNLSLYVKQVTYNSDSTVSSNWEGNDQCALNDVVDPNTEFKSKTSEGNEISVSPIQSYGLSDIQPKSVLSKVEDNVEQIHDLNPLVYQIEAAITGDVECKLKLSTNDTSVLPEVHAYVPTHAGISKETTVQTMEHESAPTDTNSIHHGPPLSADSRCKLYKYPSERITVLTEKRGYLNNGTMVKHDISEVKTEKSNDEQNNEARSLTMASSNESVATLGRETEVASRRNSLYSTKSLNAISSGLNRSTTTTDQLMWALRSARDRLDTASNISGCSSHFELDSNCSERMETVSTISDVSGYEEEMYRIRRLLFLDSPSSSVDKHNYTDSSKEQHRRHKTLFDLSDATRKVDVFTHEGESDMLQIHRLNIQLQNCVAEKEKYKIQLAEVETKMSLEWQEKYNEILRQKAHTEGRLEIVQKELEALCSERHNLLDHSRGDNVGKHAAKIKALLQEIDKLTLDHNNTKQKARKLEEQKQELSLQLELKDSEFSHSGEEIKELESSNEKLRIELQELRVEMESKDGAVHGLKEKVAEQHVEFQSLYQAKLKAENNLTTSKNEIEYLRKSVQWYRDQLHVCQTSKHKVQQELMASQTNVVSLSHAVEKLKCENAQLLQSVKDIQQQAVREKEALMRKLEVIQADIMEREAIILSQIHSEDVTSKTVASITEKLQKMEENKENTADNSDISLAELEERIETLNKELSSKDDIIEHIEAENVQLMIRVTTLQKMLNEKELVLQGFENKYRHLEMTYVEASEMLRSKEQNLIDIKNENINFEVAFAAAKREKVEVDEAICKLREDFSRISKSYNSMKSEIKNKNKHIENLETQLSEHIKVEQMQCIEIEDLKKIGEELKAWQSKCVNIPKMEEEIDHLTKKNNELKSKVSTLVEIRDHLQENVMKLEEKIAYRENQLISQAQSFEVYNEEQKTLNKKIADENRELKDCNSQWKSKVERLEVTNANLQTELETMKKRALRTDGVIEQFNTLCRVSEQEKQELQEQLKRVMKDLEETQLKLSIKNISENTIFQEHTLPNTNECVPQTDGQTSLDNKNIQCNLCPVGENTTIETKEVVCEKPKGKPIDQVMYTENRYAQSNLHQIQALVEKCLKKVVFLMPTNSNTSISEVEIFDVPSSTMPDIVEVSARLGELNQLLDTVLEKQELCPTEKKTVMEKLVCSPVKLKENGKVLEEEKHSILSTSSTTSGKESTAKVSKVLADTSSVRNKDQVPDSQKEIEKLKCLLKMTEVEQQEKYKRYEINVRTLLKKVKEHMRGRKVAERTLEVLRSKIKSQGVNDADALLLEVKKLETEVETYRRQYEEQKRIAEKNQSILLDLEKERGKLVQSQDVLKEQITFSTTKEESETPYSVQFDQQTRELHLQEIQRRVTELEHEVASLNKSVREWKKKLFSEKCENSQLRKQLSSMRMALDSANDMLDNKNIEVGRNETWRQLLSRKYTDLQKTLELEQRAHEECRKELELLKGELEETRAKDPVLADQIKSLSCHLHQKTQEATGLQEKILLAEERWLTIERGLQQNINVLQEEMASLRIELESVNRNKLLFQTQAAELRAALHSSLERNKILKLKLEAYSCDSNKDGPPDLTSSLPLPPTKYDEAQIAELLHQSSVLPNNKPLSNLQCCLDSLKQEMATLQMQLTAKTTGYVIPATDSVVQNI